MNFIIDTVALSDFFKAEPRSAKKVHAAEIVYLPVIVIGEYKAGIYGGSQKKSNLDLLQKFLDKSSSTILAIDEQTSEHFARLRAFLRKRGTPLPINDIWIAALCVQYNLPLLTRDEDFKRLPQVQLI